MRSRRPLIGPMGTPGTFPPPWQRGGLGTTSPAWPQARWHRNPDGTPNCAIARRVGVPRYEHGTYARYCGPVPLRGPDGFCQNYVPIPGQPGLFQQLDGFIPPNIVARFGPSIWNTPAARLAYVEEVNRRMLALDDAIRGGHKGDADLRKQWAAFFRSWQSWLEGALGGAEQGFLDRLRRSVNLLIPYSVVEAANRFDNQWNSFSKKAQAAGVKVPIDPGEPLDEGVNWETIAIGLAITAVAAWALVKGPKFGKVSKPKFKRPKIPARFRPTRKPQGATA